MPIHTAGKTSASAPTARSHRATVTKKTTQRVKQDMGDSQAGAPTQAKSIWKGAINFGLVTIPVRLVAATGSKDIAFHLLHARCSTRLHQVRWCPKCKREVPWDETARGYEYSKGKYVVLTDADFESLPSAAKHTVDLTAFVRLSEIDPVYFEKSYYLEPEQTALKSYSLLVEALEQKHLIGIGTIAMRERERLCALRPSSGSLVLETLFYADELRQHASTGQVEISDRELDMALKLIDFLTVEFKPESYRDEYRDSVLALIEAKVNGDEVTHVEEPHDDKIINLMDALKASISAAQSGQQQSTGNAAGTRRTRKSA